MQRSRMRSGLLAEAIAVGCRSGKVSHTHCTLWRDCRSALALPNLSSNRCFATAKIGQPHPDTHPHLLKPGEVTPGILKQEYEERRTRFMAALPEGSLALIPAAPERFMTNDIPYVFHQNNDFLYLCGYQEPDAMLALRKSGGRVHMTMFVRPCDPKKEIWEGPRAGMQGAVSFFGADEAHPVAELDKWMGDLWRPAKNVFFDSSVHPGITKQLETASLPGAKTIISPKNILHGMRVVKSESEMDIMRKSTQISGESFKEIMRATKPGLIENLLEARFEYEIKSRGAQRIAYPPVFATGINANTLHYIANDTVMQDGEVILVDAGGEYNNFASDITRTWPVNGRFTRAQREVYEGVLYVQAQIIEHCTAPNTINFLHGLSVALVKKVLKSMGVPKPEEYIRYYPHGIGHWVGMDVHDVPDVSTDTPLQPGMMLTVEPGIYIPNTPDVPSEYRGIGIRTEDDILLTRSGIEVLTRAAPKSVAEIEDVMSSAK